MYEKLLLLAMTPLALFGGATSLRTEGNLPLPEPKAAFAQTHSTPQTGTTLALTKGPDGLLHTIVLINGVAVDMIVDTGANRSILSENDALRAAVESSQYRTLKIRTLGGERILKLHDVSEIEFAGRRFHHSEVGIVVGASVSIMGLDWLSLAGPVTLPATF